MPALITPFNRRGDIDLRAHGHNVATMWDLGIRGLLIAGSTGEGPYLEPGERHALVETARDATPRAFLLCGIHAETVRTAQRGIEEAHGAGADAALITTPTTLVRHRPDRIESFFDDLIADSPLPVLLYSVPKVTGVELAEASVERLAQRPAVIGMKDSGGDSLRAGRISQSAGEEFSLFIGATAAITLSVASGGFGAITASANYAPRLVRDTVIAARRSPRAAAPLQSALTNAAGEIEQFGIPGVKYAASRVGLAAGRSRLPLTEIDTADKRAVRRALTRAGLSG